MRKDSFYHFLDTKGLLIIILLTFVIRLAFFVTLKPWENEVVKQDIIIGDALEYHPLALSFLSSRSFDAFNAFRTPGYPVFIALIYSLSSQSVWMVLLMQILLSLISCLLVYKIAVSFSNHQIALLSALLYAIDSTQAYWTIALYTETLFLFLFLFSVYFLCKSINKPSFLSISLSALFLGLATLVRPISFLFPFVAILVIIFVFSIKTRLKLAYSIVYSFIFIAIISPWLIHNYTKYGEAKLSSISGFNLLLYNASYTEVYRTGKPIEEVRKDFTDIAVKQGLDTTDKESFKSSQIYSDIAKQYIKSNLILYCKRNFMGIINMYSGLGTEKLTSLFHLKTDSSQTDPFGSPGIFTRIQNFFKSKTKAVIFISITLGLYLLMNYIFAFYGLFYIKKNQWKFLFLFILIILYYSSLTGVVGYDRYRIPIMPFINILCAFGLYYFYLNVISKLPKFINKPKYSIKTMNP